MARRRIARDQLALQRYAPAAAVAPIPGTLPSTVFERQQAAEAHRQRFGRAISMDKIEVALRQSHRGDMRAITDLARETLDTDPHLASVVNKRLGAVSSLPVDIVPATGTGSNFNPEKAAFYAEVVRAQINRMEGLHQALYQLAWALFDGRAALEKVWVKLPEGGGMTHPQFGTVRWALGNLCWIHPRRLSFGPNRELRVNDESSGGGGNFAPTGMALGDVPFKFVWWLPQLFGEYPEREGLAPRCLYWSFFKRFAARERMILTELFGKPWRILEVDEESSASAEDLEAADGVIDQLGGTNSARIPRGTKLNVVSPAKSAGEVHSDIIRESDDQMSKLVLGQTGTTDGTPAGLNNNQANVMQDEQLGILIFDAHRLSEVMESMVADEIIALNFGWGEVDHAPRVRLRSDLPADRAAELQRLDAALKAGLSIAREEAYAVSGFRVPNDDEAQIRIEQPPTPPNSPVAPQVRPVVIYPANTSPAVGEQQPTAPAADTGEGAATAPTAQVGAADAAKTITVNEDREARGLDPLALPDGSPDPDGDLTISEYDAKHTAAPEPEAPEPEDDDPDDDGGGTGGGGGPTIATPPTIATRPTVSKLLTRIPPESAHVATALIRAYDEVVAAEEAEKTLQPIVCGHCGGHTSVACIRDHRQPETANGSPETILERAMPRVRSVMRKLADDFMLAVSEKDTAIGIFGALNRAREKFNDGPLARELERRMIQAAALGSIDNAYEIGLDATDEEKTTLSRVILAPTPSGPPDFSKMRFDDALKHFKSKSIVPRTTFDRLSTQAKTRAFTVAGVVADDALRTLHSELATHVAEGRSLRDFAKAVEARMKSAGFLAQVTTTPAGKKALTASHVETVFRTNALNAYNAGRAVHAKQPAVVRARPVWEWRAVNQAQTPEGYGTRPTHAAAQGKMVLASDPIWQVVYPPVGYNCRCRVVTRPAKLADKAIPGSMAFPNLPDPGFSSGAPGGTGQSGSMTLTG